MRRRASSRSSAPASPTSPAGRPRRAGVRAELRPLHALRRRPPRALRARRRRQRRRDAALRRAPAFARRRAGQPPLGCSAFAEYATVSRRSLVKIDRELPLDEAALFGCAVLTGVGAVVNTAKVAAGHNRRGGRPRRRGPRRGARRVARRRARIVAVDLADDKLELAQALGATDAFNAGARRLRRAGEGGDARRRRFRIRDRRLGRAPRARVQVTRRGGTTVTAGLPPPTRQLRGVPTSTSSPRSARSRAATSARACPRATCRATSRYTAQGRLPVDRLLTGRLKLDEINEGFDRLREGKAVRQVIVF